MKKYTRRDFLEALFSDYFRKREGFLMVKVVRQDDNKVSTRYFPNMEILAKENFSEEQNVFFGTCPHDNMKPDRGHIRFLTALWAGLDLSPEGYSGKRVYFFGQPQAAKAIRSFPLPPSIIVESGTGVHLYWLMKDVVTITDPDAMEVLLGRINGYFKCNSHIPLNSIMRLPFTTNCKIPGRVLPCSIKYINTDFRYTLEEFQNLDIWSQIDSKESEKWTDMLKSSSGRSDDSYSDVGDISASSRPMRDVPGTLTDKNARAVGVNPKKPLAGTLRNDFEPVPYEDVYPEQTPTSRLYTEDVSTRLSDETVEKIAQRVSSLIIERLSDEIVAKLSKRLGVL